MSTSHPRVALIAQKNNNGRSQQYDDIMMMMPVAVSRLQTLGKMQASDELTEAQVRQLLFDLESSYQAFNQLLHST